MAKRTLDPEQRDALLASAHLESSLTVARHEGFYLAFAADDLVIEQWQNWMEEKTIPFGHLLAVAKLVSGEPPCAYLALSVQGVTKKMQHAASALTVITDTYRAQRDDELVGAAPSRICLMIVEQKGQLITRHRVLYDEEQAKVRVIVPVPTIDIRTPYHPFREWWATLRHRLRLTLHFTR